MLLAPWRAVRPWRLPLANSGAFALRGYAMARISIGARCLLMVEVVDETLKIQRFYVYIGLAT